MGKEYKRHYDIWLIGLLQRQRAELGWTSQPSTPESNPFDFGLTDEVFGITRIPDSTCLEYNLTRQPAPIHLRSPEAVLASSVPRSLLRFGEESHLSGQQFKPYEYLASAQQLIIPATSIHRPREFALFNEACGLQGPFAPQVQKEPNFDDLAKWWNRHDQVNGKEAFYKLPEILEAHYKRWKERKDELTTRTLSERARERNSQCTTSLTHRAKVLPPAMPALPGILAHKSHTTQPQGTAQLQVIQPHSVHRSQDITHSPVLPAGNGPAPTLLQQATTLLGVSLTNNWPVNALQQNGWTFQMHAQPLASGSVAYAAPVSGPQSAAVLLDQTAVTRIRQPRRCKVCLDSGRDGVSCPGKNNRANCRYNAAGSSSL